MSLELWEHQKKAIEQGSKSKDYGLFWDPGTGKTRTIIEILRNHYNAKQTISRTYIFAPLVVLGNWKAEIRKYSKIPEEAICILSGSTKEKVQALKENTKAKIFITNYDSLIKDEFVEEMLARPAKICVFDEVHRLKNTTAKRTKSAMKIADSAERRFIMTGTPILRSYLDIFGQFRVLDSGETFGRNFFIFRAEYFWDKNAGMNKLKYFPNWVPRADAEARLQQKIQNKVSIAKKEECLDLPPLIEKEIIVEMSQQQKRVYDQMKQDFIAYLNDSACVATLAITKALRLQQIVSGFMQTDKGETIFFDNCPRIVALEDCLEDLLANDQKIIIWAVFKQNYFMLQKVCEKLKVNYSMLTGDIQDKEKQISRFRTEKDVPIMIAHPGAGGIGVNLIEAAYSIVYSRGFSFEFEEQSKARNYRGGSEMHNKITRMHLITENSIDRLIHTALAKKLDLSNKILTLKDYL